MYGGGFANGCKNQKLCAKCLACDPICSKLLTFVIPGVYVAASVRVEPHPARHQALARVLHLSENLENI